MMNTHERDVLAPPPGIPERAIPANLRAIAFPRPPRKEPADWRALGAAADALGIGVVRLNEAGEPDLCNDYYHSLLGALERTALPADGMTLTGTKPLAQSIRRWRGETASVGVHAGNVLGNAQEGRTADGRVIRYAVQPLAQGGIVCLGMDVTAQKRLERDLAKIQAAAESASNAKSLFLSSMSHELRTPLNAVIGFTQMMIHDVHEPPTARQRESLEIVFQSAGHLLDLLSRVLDLQKIEAGQVEIQLAPVSVTEVAQESMDMLAFQAKARGIVINGENLCDGATAILADPIRFRQIMANLLSNAIKYNRPGGHVWVTCAVDERGWCRIGVRDTGNGVPHHRRDEVFKPFNRLGREAGRIEGTGIGLAISKDLVERMGGRIGFESDPGRGSTFWVEMLVVAA